MPSIILQSPVPERTADQFSGYRYACYPAYVSRKNGYDHNDQGKEIEEFILMEQHDKLVYFKDYCAKCRYANESEVDDPCFDCLADPTNTDSHKPVKFEEK